LKNISDLYYLLDSRTIAFLYADISRRGDMPLPALCPSCGSRHFTIKNHAKKIGGVTGAIGGTASGASGAITGAKSGAVMGAFAGPLGISVGSVAGAVVGGLLGGAVGSITGATVGQTIDSRVLDNYLCRHCGTSFTPG
jgi:hypothetical protein